MEKAVQWTSSQRDAIEASGRNVLVNAGAGAGKTAALIERIFRLVAAPGAQSSIDRLLVVTFTRAAAGEMRERLGARLRIALAEARAGADDDRVRRIEEQLGLLPRAQISTLHSFCLTLLREHPEKIGMPPDFDLMDDEEARLLRRDAIDAAVEAALGEEAHVDAARGILGQMAPVSAASDLADIVVKLQNFLESLPSPEEWAGRVLDELAEAADESLAFDSTVCGRRIRAWYGSMVDEAVRAAEEFLRTVPRGGLSTDKMRGYRDRVDEIAAALRDLRSSLSADAPLPDAAAMLKLETKPRATKTATDDDHLLRDRHEALKETLDGVAKTLDRIPAGSSLADIRRSVASTRPFAELLLRRLGLQVMDELLAEHMRLRRLTFAHLERLSLRLLRTSEETTALLRAQFDHVLVDEFQDVNALQAELLAAASRPAPGGNRFVVGDMKQSIYGFRQADPTRFKELSDSYVAYDAGAPSQEPGARINLLENFRSVPPLLKELNAFFQALFSPRTGDLRYDDDHRFVPGRPEPESREPRLSVHFLEAALANGDHDDDEDGSDDDALADAHEQEARYVASLVAAMGPPWKRVAILLRSGKGMAPRLVAELQRAGVPLHTQESLGFLEHQEVLDVLAILRTVANPYDEAALVGCLRGPAAWWNEDEIALLRLADRRARLFDTIKMLAAGTASSLAPQCRAFVARLRGWQHAAAHEPMARFFARLHDDLNLRERVSTLPNGDDRVRNLEFLHARAVQFDAFRRKGITAFVDFVQDLLDRDEELGRPPAASADEDVVRIMTMHKSKGLQFDIVVLPFLGRKFNLGDARAQVVWDRREGFGTAFLPGMRYGEARFAAGRELLKDAIEGRSRSEELRLLYVAMTRARERLVMTASAKKIAAAIAEAQASATRNREHLDARAAAAQCPLDWIMLALGTRAEFQGLTPAEPRSAVGADGLEACMVETPSAAAAPASEGEATDVAEAQMAAWRAARPAVDEAIARVRRLGDWSAHRSLRAKISATEAKRAWEALHHELNPPAEPYRARAASQEEPPWWPASLLAAKEGAAPAGRRAGTLTHRLCALADLDAVAKGRTAREELARLVAEGYFTEREAPLILVDDVETFFRECPLGRRVLANRASVRREVPFTIRLRAGEVVAAAGEASGDVLLFQGVVDLLFTDSFTDALVLVDFKTDAWDGTAEHYEELEAAYRPQLALYSVGIERALGRPVDEAWIHFLRAQQDQRVDRAGEEEWLEWLRAAYVRGGTA